MSGSLQAYEVEPCDFALESNHFYSCDLNFCFLADNFFRTSGKNDYFGCEEYRMMALYANPNESFHTEDAVIEKPHVELCTME